MERKCQELRIQCRKCEAEAVATVCTDAPKCNVLEQPARLHSVRLPGTWALVNVITNNGMFATPTCGECRTAMLRQYGSAE